MLEMIGISQVLALASGFTVIGTAWHTAHKLKKDRKEREEAHKQAILKHAYDADAELRQMIEQKIELMQKDQEAKLEVIRKDLENYVSALDTELDHVKEKQAGEIRNLGEKIEDLRTELRTQHGQLIALVTKLVEKS